MVKVRAKRRRKRPTTQPITIPMIAGILIMPPYRAKPF